MFARFRKLSMAVAALALVAATGGAATAAPGSAAPDSGNASAIGSLGCC